MLVRIDETTQRTAQLLDALDCGVMLLDQGGRIVHANTRLCELMARPYDKLIGANFRDMYRDSDSPWVVDQVMRALGADVEQEFYLVQPGGIRRTVQLCGRSAELDLAGGPRELLVVTVTDIALQKQAEAEVREQYEEVAELSDTVLRQALALEEYSRTLEERVRQRTQQLNDANMDAVYMLAVASEAKDADTGAHVRRIQHYVERVARQMGMSEEESLRHGYSAILHDVGKMQVPDQILKKPGSLSEAERLEIQLHTLAGERILAKSPFFALARQIARSHHENWDGTGYPDGLIGETIPLAARIVRVVDVYDGLTSKRAYKPAWDPDLAAKTIIDGAGLQFDPRVVAAFEVLYQTGEIQRIQAEQSDAGESYDLDSAANLLR